MQLMKLSIVSMLLIFLFAAPPTYAQSGSQGSGGSSSMSPQDLDKLMAPIALYPDALVTQILTCASTPYEVKAVASWLDQNQNLKGSALQQAASKQGFDPSFVAIVLFPQVLDKMAKNMSWTEQVGQAFKADQNAVLASVQRLRSEAKAMGNLQSTQQQKVETSSQNGQTVISIQPANPQIVYVPEYNPQVVYTQPAPSTTQSSSNNEAAAAMIGFAAGVIVGAAADNDNDQYYYSCGGWGYHGCAVYPGGWNNYYNYRENMNNDYYHYRENQSNNYYNYRENMADQRGENQQNRQSTWTQGQENRENTWNQSQQNRENTWSQGQENRSQNQQNRQSTWSQGQSDREQNRSNTQSNWQNNRQSAADNRGGFDRGSFQGGGSSAFSGYQRGSSTRASSERGFSSLGGRGGGVGGGRGGFGGGGGFRGRR